MHNGFGGSVAGELPLSTASLLNALSAPVMLFNSDCEILLSNSAVEGFLARRTWLWTVDRRLKCRDPSLVDFEKLVRLVSTGQSHSNKLSVVLNGPKDDKVLLSGSVRAGVVSTAQAITGPASVFSDMSVSEDRVPSGVC